MDAKGNHHGTNIFREQHPLLRRSETTGGRLKRRCGLLCLCTLSLVICHLLPQQGLSGNIKSKLSASHFPSIYESYPASNFVTRLRGGAASARYEFGRKESASGHSVGATPMAPMTPHSNSFGSTITMNSAARSPKRGNEQSFIPNAVELSQNQTSEVNAIVGSAIREGKSCAEIGSIARRACIDVGVPANQASFAGAKLAMRATAAFLARGGHSAESIIEAAEEVAISAGLWGNEKKVLARDAMLDSVVDAVIGGNRAPQHLFEVLMQEGYSYEDAVWRATELVANRYSIVVLERRSSAADLLALLRAMLNEGGEGDGMSKEAAITMQSEAAARLALDSLAEASAFAGFSIQEIVAVLEEVRKATSWKKAGADMVRLMADSAIKAVVRSKFQWQDMKRCLRIAAAIGKECGITATEADKKAIEAILSHAKSTAGASIEQLVMVAKDIRLYGLSRDNAAASSSSTSQLKQTKSSTSEGGAGGGYYEESPALALHACSVVADIVCEDTLCRGASVGLAARDAKNVVTECGLQNTEVARTVIKSIVKSVISLGGSESELNEAIRTSIAEVKLSTTQAQVFGIAKSVLNSLRSITSSVIGIGSTRELFAGTRGAYTAAEHSAKAAGMSVAILAGDAVASAMTETGRGAVEIVRACRVAVLATGFSSEEVDEISAQATCKAMVSSYGQGVSVNEMLVRAEEVSRAAGLAEESSVRLMGQVAANCIISSQAAARGASSSSSSSAPSSSSPSSGEGSLESTTGRKSSKVGSSFSKEAAMQALRMMAAEALYNQPRNEQKVLSQENVAMLTKAAAAVGLNQREAMPLLDEFNIFATANHAIAAHEDNLQRVSDLILDQVIQILSTHHSSSATSSSPPSRAAIKNMIQLLHSTVRASAEVVASRRRSPADVAHVCMLVKEGLLAEQGHSEGSFPLTLSFVAIAEGVSRAGVGASYLGETIKEIVARKVLDGINDDDYDDDEQQHFYEGERGADLARMVVQGVHHAITIYAKALLRGGKSLSQVAKAALATSLAADLEQKVAGHVAGLACSRVVFSLAMEANRSAESVVSEVTEIVESLPASVMEGGGGGGGTTAVDYARVAANMTITCLADFVVMRQKASSGQNAFEPDQHVSKCMDVAAVAGIDLEQFEGAEAVTKLILITLANAIMDTTWSAAGSSSSSGSSASSSSASFPSAPLDKPALSPSSQQDLITTSKHILLALGPSMEKAAMVSKWLAKVLTTAQCKPESVVEAVMHVAGNFGLRTYEAEEVCLDEIANGAISHRYTPEEIGVAVEAAATYLGRDSEDAARTASRAYIRRKFPFASSTHELVRSAMDAAVSCGLPYPKAAQIVSVIAAEETMESCLGGGRMSSIPSAVEAAKDAALAAGLPMKEASQITALVSVRAVVRNQLKSDASVMTTAKSAVMAAKLAGLSPDAAGLTSATLISKEVANWMLSEEAKRGHSPAVVGNMAAKAALACWRTCESFHHEHIPSSVVSQWQAAVAEAMVYNEAAPDHVIVAVKDLAISSGMSSSESSLSTARIATRAIVDHHLLQGRDHGSTASIAKSIARLCGLEDHKASVVSADVVCKSMINTMGNIDDVSLAQNALRAVLATGLTTEEAANITGRAIAQPMAERLIREGVDTSSVVLRLTDAVTACGMADESIVRSLVAFATAKCVAEGKAAAGESPSNVVRAALEAAREGGVKNKDARVIVTKVAVRAVVDAAVRKGGIREVCGVAREAGAAVADVGWDEEHNQDEVAKSVVRAATEAMLVAGRDPGETVDKAKSLLKCLQDNNEDTLEAPFTDNQNLMVAQIAARIQAELLVEGGTLPRQVAEQAKEVAYLAGVTYAQAARIATESTIQALVHDMVQKDQLPSEIASAATEAALAAKLSLKETAVSSVGSIMHNLHGAAEQVRVRFTSFPEGIAGMLAVMQETGRVMYYLGILAVRIASVPFELYNFVSEHLPDEGRQNKNGGGDDKEARADNPS